MAGVLFYAVLATTFIVYVPGHQGPFMLDDSINIPRTAVNSLKWEQLEKHAFWSPKLSGYSRALTNISFALSQFVGGLDPYIFKYQNTLLHLINGALVFWLASLLLGYRTADQREATLLALAVTAVWLLHPLQVSTVLYATQRLVLLSTLFVLLALITYVKARIWSFKRPLIALISAATGVLAFGTLGILSKEIAVLLPLYLAAVELFFFRMTSNSAGQRRLLQVFLSLFVAIPIIIGLAYAATHMNALVGGYSSRAFTLEQRLLTEVHAIGLYLKLFFIPLPAGMSLFHDNFPIQRELDLHTAALASGYLFLIVAAFRLRTSRYAPIGFGILWFFLCHSLESTFISLEPVFEHRNYLAILGLAFVLVLGMARLLATPNLERVAPALMLGLVALLAFNTAARAFVWGNGELMLRTEYLQHPDSPRVLNGLFELELGLGNPDEARRFLSEAKRLAPDSPSHRVNELRTYCEAENLPADIAEQARRDIIRDAGSTGLFSALDALTSDLLKDACPTVGYQVVHDLITTYTDSTAADATRERFLSLILRGRLLTSQKQWVEAEACYADALDLVDGSLSAYPNLAINELFGPFLRAGQIDSLGRLLSKVAKPVEENTP